MSKEKRRVPKLRFPGFAEDWEQRKLCQITTRVTRKNGSQSDLPLTISAQDGLVDQRKYFNRQVASRDMSNYYLIKKGEFAYNKSYSEGYPFGAVKRLDHYDIGALSTLYILFEITDNAMQTIVKQYPKSKRKLPENKFIKYTTIDIFTGKETYIYENLRTLEKINVDNPNLLEELNAPKKKKVEKKKEVGVPISSMTFSFKKEK